MADQAEETKPEPMHPAKKIVLDHLVNIYRATRALSGPGINADTHDNLRASVTAIETFINENFTEPEKESEVADAPEHEKQ